jgi:hypothetical protein
MNERIDELNDIIRDIRRNILFQSFIENYTYHGLSISSNFDDEIISEIKTFLVDNLVQNQRDLWVVWKGYQETLIKQTVLTT